MQKNREIGIGGYAGQELLIAREIRENPIDFAREEDALWSQRACQVDKEILGRKDRAPEGNITDDISVNEGNQAHFKASDDRMEIPGLDMTILGGNAGGRRKGNQRKAERLRPGKKNLVQASRAVPDLLVAEIFLRAADAFARAEFGSGMVPKRA